MTTGFLIALICAAAIGLAAHRASLCHVKAVSEVMSSGTTHMLKSLTQAVLWAGLVSGAIAVVGTRALQPVWLPSVAAWALFGGWLFGIGAALNGGCSLSTLHRLVDGELGMLATLLGFALGVVASAIMVTTLAAPGAVAMIPVAPVWQRWPALAPWLLGLLALWAFIQLLAFVRLARVSASRSLRQRLVARQYPLGVSAALMGVAGGILYTTQGAWSYTNHVRASVLQAWAGGLAPVATHSALVGALLVGMAASAVQRGSIAWRRPPAVASWLRHGTGGLLMGAGAAMVPGGNDTMLLNALPTLAIQALGAYLAMLLGIASALWLMRRARVPMATTHCSDAGCSETPTLSTHHTRQEPTP
jgi:hypothetical protein